MNNTGKELKDITYEEIVLNELTEENNWERLCTKYNLQEKVYQEFPNKIYWRRVSIYQILSEDFIEKHIDIFDEDDWTCISQSAELSEKFMDKYSDKLY